MVFDIKTQAMVNLTIQVLLIMTVSGAVFLAKKRNLGKHCIVMRVAVLLQIIVIAGVMRARGRLATAMRLALGSWILALIIGLHMYILIWM